MAARIGSALYWLGCLAAILFALFALYALAALAGFFGGTADPAALAIGCWLAGWIARYLLSW